MTDAPPTHAPPQGRCRLSACLPDPLPKHEGKGAFLALLENLQQSPQRFVPLLAVLWRGMESGGFAAELVMLWWRHAADRKPGASGIRFGAACRVSFDKLRIPSPKLPSSRLRPLDGDSGTHSPIRVATVGFPAPVFFTAGSPAHAGNRLVVTQVFGSARVRFPEAPMRREQQERVLP